MLPIDIDEGELAIVFANALGNVIHANLKLPRARGKSVAMLLANPILYLYFIAVQSNGNGVSLTGKDGQGVGT